MCLLIRILDCTDIVVKSECIRKRGSRSRARAKSLRTYEGFHVHTLPTSGSSVEVTWTQRRTPWRNRRKKIRECDEGGMWENMNIMSNRWRTSPSIAGWKNNGIHSRPLLRKQFKQRPGGNRAVIPQLPHPWTSSLHLPLRLAFAAPLIHVNVFFFR